MLLLMLGAAVVEGFRESLWGHEIFLTNFYSMRKHLSKGRAATPAMASHILLTLLRQFKGETDEQYNLTSLASTTNSILLIPPWMTMLLVAWDM